MSNINVIETLAHTLNESELSDAIRILVKARKERQANQLLEMKNTLMPGDTVEFTTLKKGSTFAAQSRRLRRRKRWL